MINKGMEIHGSGQPLLFLHGWGLNRTVWRTVAERLSDQYSCILLDLPGHGENADEEMPATLEGCCHWIHDRTPADTTWIGWSLSGLLALQANTMELTRQSILISSTPKFCNDAHWSYAIDENILDDFALQLQQDYEKTIQRFLAIQAMGSQTPKEEVRELKKMIHSLPAPYPEALRTTLGWLKSVDLRKNLERPAPPVHFILGERDTLVRPSLQEYLQALDSDTISVDILKGAAHACFLTHQDNFIQSLENALHHQHG